MAELQLSVVDLFLSAFTDEIVDRQGVCESKTGICDMGVFAVIGVG